MAGHPILWRTLGTLGLGLTAVAVVGAWRLSQGPVDISAALPLIENRLPTEPVSVSIEGLHLAWEGGGNPVEFLAENVAISSPDGSRIAQLPRIAVDLDFSALMRRQIQVNNLVLDQPAVSLTVAEDGGIEWLLDDNAGTMPDELPLSVGEGAVDPAVLLLGEDGTGGLLGPVEAVGVRNATVRIDDRHRGIAGTLDGFSVSLRPDATTLTLTAESRATLDGSDPFFLNAEADFDPFERRGETRVSLEGLRISQLADLHPDLKPMEEVDLSLALEATAVFEGAFLPDRIAIDLTTDGGRVWLRDFYSEPIFIAGISGRIDIDRLLRTATIMPVRVDLGGPVLAVEATLIDAGALLDVDTVVRIEHLPIDLLATYWPDLVRGGGRTWITTNISRGIVTEAEATAHLQLPIGDGVADEDRSVIRQLEGFIDFSGGTVRPLRLREGEDPETWLPQITGIDGRASFTTEEFRVVTEGGQMGAVYVPRSEIVITGFDQEIEDIDIDAEVSGPVPEVLRILDSRPLEYVGILGLSPNQTTGDTAGRLRFRFPLYRDLTFDEVRLAAAANLRDGSLSGFIDGVELTGLEGQLSLDGNGLTLSGSGQANGVDADFTWLEPFQGSAVTEIIAEATLDNADRDAIGLIPDIGEILGLVTTQLRYGPTPTGSRIDLSTDISTAETALEELNWRKPAGVPGTLDLSVILDDGSVTGVDPIILRAGDTSLDGRLTLDGAGDLATLTVERLQFAGTDASAQITATGPDHYTATVRGRSLDMVTLLNDPLGRDDEDWTREDRAERLEHQVDTPEAPVAVESDQGTEPETPGPSFEVTSLALDQVRVTEDRVFNRVAGSLAFDGIRLSRLDVTAETESGASLSVEVGPRETGGDSIKILAADAGAVIRAMDISGSISGGGLDFIAERTSFDDPYTGTLRLSDFLLREAPVAARVLAAVSLVGLADAANTQGLSFDLAEIEFTDHDGFLELRNGRANGSSIGITVEGAIDLDAGQLDLAGSVVPVAGLNRFLGAIPLLGAVLTGGENGGVIAFNYRVSGAIDDPQVSVNPLSALTPGFLRSVFFSNSEVGRALAETRAEGRRSEDSEATEQQ